MFGTAVIECREFHSPFFFGDTVMDRRGFLARISGALAAMGLVAVAKGSDKIGFDADDVVVPPLANKPGLKTLGLDKPAISVPLTKLPEELQIGDKRYDIKFDRIATYEPQPPVGGHFYYDQATLFFQPGFGNDRIGLLAQGVDVRYSQTLNKVFWPGDPQAYYLAGRTQATMRIARLIAPDALMTEFMQKFGDVMNARDNHLFVEPLQYPRISYQLRNFVLSSVGPTVTAGEKAGKLVIGEQVQGMFLDWTSIPMPVEVCRPKIDVNVVMTQLNKLKAQITESLGVPPPTA